MHAAFGHTHPYLSIVIPISRSKPATTIRAIERHQRKEQQRSFARVLQVQFGEEAREQFGDLHVEDRHAPAVQHDIDVDGQGHHADPVCDLHWAEAHLAWRLGVGSDDEGS